MMKAKRLIAAAASIAMMLTMAAAVPFNVFADTSTVYDANIEGTKVTSFEKYLVMKSDAVVPEASFSFTIEGGEAVSATETTMPVLKGVGAPTFLLKSVTDGMADSEEKTLKTNDNVGTAAAAKVSFSAADTDVSGVTIAEIDKGEGKTVKFVTESDRQDEKYAQKKIAIDFSNVTFTEPGIYRYIITESAAGANQAAGVTNDSDNTRVLDVVVSDSSAGGTNKLSITKYLLHDNVADAPQKGTGSSAGTATIDHKSTGFTNNYETYNLEFSKTVAGNQGSRDKYFKFDVNISNAKGAQITVDGQFLAEPHKSTTTSYTASDMKAANTRDDDDTRTGQQLSANADGEITASFYIRHGQSVKLLGLPAGAKYTVVEDEEDYTPSVNVTEAVASGSTFTADAAANTDGNGITDSTSGIHGNTNAAFTNTREGTIPTGIISNVGLSVAIIAVAAAGAVVCFIFIKKKKSEED